MIIAHGRWHAAQQGGYFRAGQRVAVYVVHEEKHVAAFVAERFGNGQPSKRHAQAVAGPVAPFSLRQSNERLFFFATIFLIFVFVI